MIDLIEYAVMNYAALMERNPEVAVLITKEEYIKAYCAQYVRDVIVTSGGSD